MKKLLIITTLATVGCLSSVAAVIVNETFEGYSTTAEMEAVWGPASGLGVLVSTNGNGGNSAYHPGGTVNSYTGFSVIPSVSETLVLTADIYDSAVGSAQRNTVGLRNGANPLFEMGHYNGQSSQYAVRVLSLYGGDGIWAYFPSVSRTAGWNRYEATFTGTSATITLDLGADGSVDSTLVFNGALPANPFVDLRFGGPSNNSSAAPAWFDNIRLETIVVPEPSSLAFALLGGFGLFVARMRRQ